MAGQENAESYIHLGTLRLNRDPGAQLIKMSGKFTVT